MAQMNINNYFSVDIIFHWIVPNGFVCTIPLSRYIITNEAPIKYFYYKKIDTGRRTKVS